MISLGGGLGGGGVALMLVEGPRALGGAGGELGDELLGVEAAAAIVAAAPAVDAVVGAGIAGAELKSVGAVNADLHSGQLVVLPARSSAMLIGSEQFGQNTRMRGPQ